MCLKNNSKNAAECNKLAFQYGRNDVIDRAIYITRTSSLKKLIREEFNLLSINQNITFFVYFLIFEFYKNSHTTRLDY